MRMKVVKRMMVTKMEKKKLMYYVYGHNMSSGSARGGCKRKHGKTHGERTDI